MSSVRTKLSHYKVFHRKPISNGSEKNTDTYEKSSLLRFLNIRSV